MSKTVKVAHIRKTRAVKGPRIATRRGHVIEVPGTPAGTYVDPLVLKEYEEIREDMREDDPEDVYTGPEDVRR